MFRVLTSSGAGTAVITASGIGVELELTNESGR